MRVFKYPQNRVKLSRKSDITKNKHEQVKKEILEDLSVPEETIQNLERESADRSTGMWTTRPSTDQIITPITASLNEMSELSVSRQIGSGISYGGQQPLPEINSTIPVNNASRYGLTMEIPSEQILDNTIRLNDSRLLNPADTVVYINDRQEASIQAINYSTNNLGRGVVILARILTSDNLSQFNLPVTIRLNSTLGQLIIILPDCRLQIRSSNINIEQNVIEERLDFTCGPMV